MFYYIDPVDNECRKYSEHQQDLKPCRIGGVVIGDGSGSAFGSYAVSNFQGFIADNPTILVVFGASLVAFFLFPSRK